MSRNNRDCSPNDRIAPDELSRNQSDQLEKCLAGVILCETTSKHIGQARSNEENADLLHSTLTLRAQHICMQV
jgi:hypothetical protein